MRSDRGPVFYWVQSSSGHSRPDLKDPWSPSAPVGEVAEDPLPATHTNRNNLCVCTQLR